MANGKLPKCGGIIMKNALTHASWKIATVMGIPIRIHVSWFIVFGLITWSLSSYYFPGAAPDLTTSSYWIKGAIAAILLFGSVVFHELAHSYVAKKHKIPISSITLFIFGGVAQMDAEPPTPKAEFKMAIAGPISNFILAAFLLILYSQPSSPSLKALCLYLLRVNLILGVFNLIPGFPMDGGRILRAIIWKFKNDYYFATRQASMVGQKIGLAFLLFGVFFIFIGNFAGIWLMIIGWFLYSGAHGSYLHTSIQEKLSGIRVKDVMATEIVSLTPSMTIDEVVYKFFLKYAYSGFPVFDNGKFLGIITLKEIKHVHRRDWQDVKVSEILDSYKISWNVSPDLDVTKALELMMTENKGRFIVMRNGEVVGLITRNGIARYLQIMQDDKYPYNESS